MKRKNTILTMILALTMIFWICAASSASAQQAEEGDKAKKPPRRAAARQAGDKKPDAPGKKMRLEERLERLEKAVKQLGVAARQNRRNLDTDRPRTDEPGKVRAGRRAPRAEGQGRDRAGRRTPGAEGRGRSRQGAASRRGTVGRGIPDDRSDPAGRGAQRRQLPARRLGEWARENPDKAGELRERFKERMQGRRPNQADRLAPSRGQGNAGQRFRGEDLKGRRNLNELGDPKGRLEQQPEQPRRLRERVRDPRGDCEQSSLPPKASGS